MARKPSQAIVLDLLVYTFGDMRHPLAIVLSAWLAASARFYDFCVTYRDKIRKKARTAQDAESLRDLQAELAMAYLLLQDRRCVVEYEPLGVGKQRAPDFRVLFKTHTAFSVEVTRLRPPAGASENLTGNVQKVVNTLGEKLGQLPPSVVNLLAIVSESGLYTPDDLRSAWQFLQERARQRDDVFFALRGLVDTHHFHRQQQRLSAILLCTMHNNLFAVAADPWLHPQPKHPLSKELKNLLRTLVGKSTM
jgi:hypothetical protein